MMLHTVLILNDAATYFLSLWRVKVPWSSCSLCLCNFSRSALLQLGLLYNGTDEEKNNSSNKNMIKGKEQKQDERLQRTTEKNDVNKKKLKGKEENEDTL